MNGYFQYYIYLLTALLPFVWSVIRFPLMDRASRMFCYIAGVSFFGELLALLSVKLLHSNTIVYNLIGICNLVMICIYFNYAIPVFQKYAIGFILGTLSVLLWLLSFVLLKDNNTPYMFYEAILTIGMSVVSIEQLLARKSKSWIRLRKSAHFWFAWILFAYWCFTICHWLLRSSFKDLTDAHSWFNSLLLVVTMLVNIGFFLIFYRYPKMQRQDVT